VRSQGKLLPPNRRDWQRNTENHNLLEQKPLRKVVLRQENLNCNQQLLKGQYGQVWETRYCRGPRQQWVSTFYEFYLQELDQVLTGNIREKFPCASKTGRGKGTILKNTGALFFFLTRSTTPGLWPPHAKSWLIGKDSDAGRDWGQEEKGTTEDEMAGWHHWLDGRESQWTPGVGDGHGGLACCDSWGRKESDTTEQLIWSEKTVCRSGSNS